jgi:hypothetical protein
MGSAIKGLSVFATNPEASMTEKSWGESSVRRENQAVPDARRNVCGFIFSLSLPHICALCAKPVFQAAAVFFRSAANAKCADAFPGPSGSRASPVRDRGKGVYPDKPCTQGLVAANFGLSAENPDSFLSAGFAGLPSQSRVITHDVADAEAFGRVEGTK